MDLSVIGKVIFLIIISYVYLGHKSTNLIMKSVMEIVEEYGTLVDENPCSDLIGGFIKQAKVKQGFNRDHYIGSEDSTNDRNYYMEEVCAETNNQR